MRWIFRIFSLVGVAVTPPWLYTMWVGCRAGMDLSAPLRFSVRVGDVWAPELFRCLQLLVRGLGEWIFPRGASMWGGERSRSIGMASRSLHVAHIASHLASRESVYDLRYLVWNGMGISEIGRIWLECRTELQWETRLPGSRLASSLGRSFVIRAAGWDP